ncbi:DNA mismatch repair endonuclease MutL [Salinibacter sp. 10B]|uniref:DNA mismatch repair endonuclease MutL n=1 Tax=Salinibacter sp. 10B TaxID=1923971 RepID=UPI002156FDAB|nr:DNA mismatch repair endonuclease MutL [Salinibacter sp. 10B]
MAESAESSTSEGIIHVMSDRLANQIAAGEVVQRPASVEKELIENAIDAGASSVEVILKDAGSTLVQVIDDGCGMSPADAERCFERHATSKIQSVDDLERIRTLGFRGEALASIAAVSQVELKTKRVEDDAGTLVRVKGGEIMEQRPCAIQHGTSVAVQNLFFNVPARRNFLKTPATELKHLTTTAQFLSLANPTVAFRLEHDGHEHYDLAAAQSDDFLGAMKERVLGLFGDEHADELVPVQDSSSDLTIEGFVGEPSFHRKTRGEQFLFVNERYVKDRYLSHAVKKAYGDLLPDGAFPFFALFLRMDPRRVDVNVHPQKSEVKFDDQSGIYGFLRSAVRRALGRVHATPQMEGEEDSPDEGPETTAGGSSSEGSWSRSTPTSFQPRRSSNSDAESSSSSPQSPSPSSPRRPRKQENGSPSVPPGDQSDALYRPPDEEKASSDDVNAQPDSEREAMAEQDQRPVWGLHDTYIVTPTDTGMMLVDQRAAHVRVLHERNLERLREEQGNSQQLLFPHTVELSPADVDLFEDLRQDLRALGFEVERMSGRTVAVRGVPADVPDGDESAVLEDILEQYKSAQDTVEDERREQLARVMAQKSAVRRGQPLSESERRSLLRDLFECEMPYADPSGTPTIAKWSLEEIAKRFGRA